ncbi:MAG: GAF domain-containing protein [Cytophagales bacterium]
MPLEIIKKYLIWSIIVILATFSLKYYLIFGLIDAGHYSLFYAALLIFIYAIKSSIFKNYLLLVATSLPFFLSITFMLNLNEITKNELIPNYFTLFSQFFVIFSVLGNHEPKWLKISSFSVTCFGILGQDLLILMLKNNLALLSDFTFFEIYSQKTMLAVLIIFIFYFLIFKSDQWNAKSVLNNNLTGENLWEKQLLKLQKRFLESEEVLNKAFFQLQEKNQQISLQNEELQSIQEEIVAQKELIQNQYELLESKNEMNKRFSNSTFDLTKNIAFSEENLKDDLKIICKNVAETLKIEFSSIWELTHDKLNVVVFYDAIKNEFSEGISFSRDEFPRYFHAINDEKIIVSDDVSSDMRTNEFFESYFSVFGIKKMIDLPFFERGKTKGILSCESTNNEMAWQPEEVFYIKSIADVVTIAYLKQSLKTEYNLLNEKNSLIQEQNLKLKNQKDEIKRINEFLELKVEERTKVLNDRNKKLSEYAFINSHLLRGPLARIMGLVNIIKQDSQKHDDPELLVVCGHLETSCNDLDQIIRKINKIVTDFE